MLQVVVPDPPRNLNGVQGALRLLVADPRAALGSYALARRVSGSVGPYWCGLVERDRVRYPRWNPARRGLHRDATWRRILRVGNCTAGLGSEMSRYDSP